MMKLFGQAGKVIPGGEPVREMSVFFKIGTDEFFSVGIYGAENPGERLIG
ncbi:MAG: hypothetical protein OEV55_10395 [candidate division Zixibacteria bacterium]|nr:hypothetical protein [candidate division Zixibacteria bacterium]